MYQFDKLFLDNLFRDYSKVIVREIQKQNEILERNSSLNKEQSLNLLKDFNKELICESFRDLSSILRAYQLGQTFTKFKIYSPSEKKIQ